MHLADDHFVSSRGRVLHYSQQAVEDRFADIASTVRQRTAALGDDQVLELDETAWSQQLAAELEVAPPWLDTGAAEAIDDGSVTVDCTNAPGISYSSSEFGRPILREGRRLRLVIPGGGELGLLASRLARGGAGRLADINGDGLERVYEWPQVRSTDELNADMESVLAEFAQGCELIAAEVRQRNAQIADLVAQTLAERRQRILAGRSFVGGLRLPVKRRDEAATRIPDLPKARPKPRAMRQAPTARPTPVVDGPTLDEFYEHILTVIRNTVVGLERSPGRFAQAEEEYLRDHLVVTLNTHYDGATHGESFNGAGKTDILVRHANNNVFIGECKWWGGRKVLIGAIEQLLSYTTWRDNRLALVMFVGAKSLDTIVATAKAEIEQRGEFLRWSAPDRPGELTCRLRWHDGEREAALTIFFVHLPKD